MGSYDHAVLHVDSPGAAVIEAWPGNDFGDAFSRVYPLLSQPGLFNGGRAFNGLFAVTPEKLPLAGKLGGVDGLWIAAAVWVTHGAGTAKIVADLIMQEAGLETGM